MPMISAVWALTLMMVASQEAPLTTEPLLAESELVKLPTNTLLIKGTEPSASDSVTPVPESGQVVKDVYRNAYFDVALPLPKDWSENYSGPPPSESGTYVLTLAGPSPKFKGASRATLLVQAHDLFFSPSQARNAMELATFAKDHLEPFYVVERGPTAVQIANRPFVRFDYKSEAAGLHWIVLTTEIRCHAVQLIFTSSDVELLESLIHQIDEAQMNDAHPPGGAPVEGTPVCIADYATAQHVTKRVDPVVSGKQRFNSIPVRIIIDRRGRVRHTHVLSAFPEQAASITEALTQWTFTPYEVNGQREEVETGILFGYAPPWPKQAKGSPALPSDQ
jgi:hypothetical protein